MASSVADLLRYCGWFGFVAMLLRASGPGERGETVALVPRWVSIAVLAALIAALVLSEASPLAAMLGWSGRVEFGVRLALAVFGLALVEQLYRRTHAQARWAIKPLCFALIGLFAYDLFLYADAMLFARIFVDASANSALSMGCE